MHKSREPYRAGSSDSAPASAREMDKRGEEFLKKYEKNVAKFSGLSSRDDEQEPIRCLFRLSPKCLDPNPPESRGFKIGNMQVLEAGKKAG